MKRISSIVCLVLAVLLAGVGTLTAWAKLQVLDTDAWVATSRTTLQAPEVQDAVAHWSVDQVFDRTDPADALASVLPPRLAPLAGPLTSRLREESYGVAEKAMANPRVEQLWVASNRSAHQRLVRIVEGDAPILIETSRGVVLDLRPLLEGIANRIGIDPKIVDRIPDSIAEVQPKRSDDATRAIKLLRVLDGWGGLIALLGIPFLALGVWLARDRRRAWMLTGVGLIVVAILVAWAGRALGPLVAESLTQSLTWQAAVLTTWEAVTQTLRDGAAAVAIIGVLMTVLAWTTSPTGLPRRARDAMRFMFVDRPLLTLGIATALGVVLVATVDVLSARRLLIQVLLIAGFAATAWTLTRMSRSELALDAVDDPASEDVADISSNA